ARCWPATARKGRKVPCPALPCPLTRGSAFPASRSDLIGRFPDYPEEEIGGCEVLFAQKTPEEVRAELDLAETKADTKKKEKEKKGKEKKEEVKKEEEEDRKGKDKKSEEDEGLKLAPSKFLATINQGFLRYTGCWSEEDEAINFEQRYQPNLIKAEKRREVETEIRLQVDELMREELRHLRLAIDQEETKALKTKAKKSAKKRGKKGKKEKDLTPERYSPLLPRWHSEGLGTTGWGQFPPPPIPQPLCCSDPLAANDASACGILSVF
ncbi:IQ and AAA domain-containing protein 1-like, partial [Python bivittatus]|uniref:IQ and AAA domain-containing protein 1-like n=1 Tax=Python bivittatus TaxID=176946 RepID=A0A9F5IW33_PYTBI